jgi:hypothetical protein
MRAGNEMLHHILPLAGVVLCCGCVRFGVQHAVHLLVVSTACNTSEDWRMVSLWRIV